MNSFSYTRAADIEGAISEASRDVASKFIAGGTNILDLMKEINRSLQTTFVFSTHDKKVIAKADRLVRIEDGRIRRLGMRTDDGWVLVKDRRRTRDALAGKLEEAEK